MIVLLAFVAGAVVGAVTMAAAFAAVRNDLPPPP